VPPCVGVPAELALAADDEPAAEGVDEEPQAASSPPAPSTNPPLAAFSSSVRRVIWLI
jgi:hypothetical protein